MTLLSWYHAHLRWAVLVEGKEGLRHWRESVYLFPSPSREAAFREALAIGYQHEARWKEGRRWVAQRLAAVVTLDCVGNPNRFQVDLGEKRSQVHLPFEHVFEPDRVEPAPFF